MLNALKGLGHNQFEFARWAPKEYERYKIIRVEEVSERAKRFDTVIQNLVGYSEYTLLRTAYVYDYKSQQHIMFRKKWWEIVSVNEITQDVAPQTLRLVNGGNRQFLLEIMAVDGYDVE